MKCIRCGVTGYPLARVRYVIDRHRFRSGPLCFDCRGACRRLVWRKGGKVLETVAEPEARRAG